MQTEASGPQGISPVSQVRHRHIHWHRQLRRAPGKPFRVVGIVIRRYGVETTQLIVVEGIDDQGDFPIIIGEGQLRVQPCCIEAQLVPTGIRRHVDRDILNGNRPDNDFCNAKGFHTQRPCVRLLVTTQLQRLNDP